MAIDLPDKTFLLRFKIWTESIFFKSRIVSGFFSEEESLINKKEKLSFKSLTCSSIALDYFHNDFQSLYSGIKI